MTGARAARRFPDRWRPIASTLNSPRAGGRDFDRLARPALAVPVQDRFVHARSLRIGRHDQGARGAVGFAQRRDHRRALAPNRSWPSCSSGSSPASTGSPSAGTRRRRLRRLLRLLRACARAVRPGSGLRTSRRWFDRAQRARRSLPASSAPRAGSACVADGRARSRRAVPDRAPTRLLRRPPRGAGSSGRASGALACSDHFAQPPGLLAAGRPRFGGRGAEHDDLFGGNRHVGVGLRLPASPVRRRPSA